VRADNLGDVVLMGPAVRAVAASGAAVTMLCSPAGEPAARRLPGVSDVVVAPLPWIDADPRPCDPAELRSITRSVAEVGAEEAIIFTSSHQSPLPTAVLLRLGGVTRIGGISVDYPGSLLDVALRDDDDVHEVSRALRLVEAMGYRLPSGDRGSLHLDRRRDMTPTQEREEYVVVHPGASVPARTWSPSRWFDLVARLGSDGVRTVVTGAPNERALTAHVAAAHPRAEDHGGTLDLEQLLELLAAARVVVVGNTGPAHLAAAVGTPVVSIFPPTVPAARWRPWSVPHVLLGEQDIECAGCRARICPKPQPSCVAEIPTDEVVDAVARLAGVPVAGTAA
jgi:ADP-heptose:LPS heptosyltransferase